MASILRLVEILWQFQPKLANRRTATTKFAQRFYTVWAGSRRTVNWRTGSAIYWWRFTRPSPGTDRETAPKVGSPAIALATQFS
ncbi:MAG TPA: hypothetical protein PLD53_11460, partial [Candidatus Propionivibrio aalborgensis]|nr:hypothetical protein [Candidatus Propionivibrio aalborgensis]